MSRRWILGGLAALLLALAAYMQPAGGAGLVTQSGPRLFTSGGGGSGITVTCTAPTLDESGAAASIDHYNVYISQNAEDYDAGAWRWYSTANSTCSYTIPSADTAGWSAVYVWISAVSPAGAESTPLALGNKLP